MTKDAMFMATVVCSAADRYRRAGLGFKRGEQLVQVNQDQLDAINADPRLKVLNVEDEPAAATQDAADNSAANDQAAGDNATTDVNAADDQAAGDTAMADAKAADEQVAGNTVTTDAKATDTKSVPKAKAAKPKAGV